MMTASVAPGKTTRVRTRAVTAPATRERGDHAGHRDRTGLGATRMVSSRGWWVGVDAHGGLALAVGGGGTAVERGLDGRCSPRSDGRDVRGEVGQPSSSWASSPREVTPALAKTLRRWKATVRGEIQHCAATSLFDRPELTSWAILSSIGVSLTSVEGSRLRAVSPEARSSWFARAARASACRSWNVSRAWRRCWRASTRRWLRRSHSP